MKTFETITFKNGIKIYVPKTKVPRKVKKRNKRLLKKVQINMTVGKSAVPKDPHKGIDYSFRFNKDDVYWYDQVIQIEKPLS